MDHKFALGNGILLPGHKGFNVPDLAALVTSLKPNWAKKVTIDAPVIHGNENIDPDFTNEDIAATMMTPAQKANISAPMQATQAASSDDEEERKERRAATTMDRKRRSAAAESEAAPTVAED